MLGKIITIFLEIYPLMFNILFFREVLEIVFCHWLLVALVDVVDKIVKMQLQIYVKIDNFI